MDIQQIDVISLQFPQTVLDRHMETFTRVAGIIGMNRKLLPITFVGTGVLCSEDNLGSIPAFLHPLADENLTLLVLIAVGSLCQHNPIRTTSMKFPP
jgi:hypothetical protein